MPHPSCRSVKQANRVADSERWSAVCSGQPSWAGEPAVSPCQASCASVVHTCRPRPRPRFIMLVLPPLLRPNQGTRKPAESGMACPPQPRLSGLPISARTPRSDCGLLAVRAAVGCAGLQRICDSAGRVAGKKALWKVADPQLASWLRSLLHLRCRRAGPAPGLDLRP